MSARFLPPIDTLYSPHPTGKKTPWEYRDPDTDEILLAGYGGKQMFSQNYAGYNGDPRNVRRMDMFHLGGRSAMVLPITKDGRVIYLEQYYEGLNQWIRVLPAGGIGHAEQAEQAALRELVEETGFAPEANQVISVTKPQQEAPRTLTDSPVHLFLAINCSLITKQEIEPGEEINVRTVHLDRWLAHLFVHGFKEPMTGLTTYASLRPLIEKNIISEQHLMNLMMGRNLPYL